MPDLEPGKTYWHGNMATCRCGAPVDSESGTCCCPRCHCGAPVDPERGTYCSMECAWNEPSDGAVRHGREFTRQGRRWEVTAYVGAAKVPVWKARGTGRLALRIAYWRAERKARKAAR